MKKLLYILPIVCFLPAYSQVKTDTVKKEEIVECFGPRKQPFKKGSVMVFWGWNRAAYTNSDIRFRGNGYDFQLNDVVAHDRQTPFRFNIYFNPTKITIPQVNYRITYFPKDNFGITLGMDHMKYVMDLNQTVEFTGYINNPEYAAMVKDGKIDLSHGKFLHFEHTDGLNYVNLGAQKYVNVLDKKNIDIFWSYGGGIGALVPKSNVTLMGNARSDRFHLAGFGADVRTAISVVVWRHIVAQVEGKYGYINMPDVKTTLNNKPDKANQDFAYGQVNFGLGYTFNTKK